MRIIMIIAAFLICLSAKATFAVEVECENYVSCRCGSSGKNVTVCAPDDKVCSRLSNCETCDDKLITCSECPKELGGLFCSEEIRKSRQKRQIRRHWQRPGNVGLQWKSNCWVLESPKYGSIRCNSLGTERTCTGKCAPGYRFSDGTPGDIILTCKGGSWTPISKFPDCIFLSENYATCPDPGFISNGYRLDMEGYQITAERTFEEKESVAYVCESNYILSGTSLLTCKSDGTWSTSRPTCITPSSPSSPEQLIAGIPRKCPDPGHVANAERLNSDGTRSIGTHEYKVGQSLVYTCHPGYALQRRSLITCLSSGSWSFRTPYCRRIASGVVDGRTRPNQQAGPYCTDNGPISNGNALVHLPGESTMSKETSNTYPVGTRIHYSCVFGYELEGQDTLRCEQDGWNYEKPSCKIDSVKHCPSQGLEEIENGIALHIPSPKHKKEMSHHPHSHGHGAEYRYSDGCKLQYSCNDGYIMEGAATIVCNDQGRWSSGLPKCVKSSVLYCPNKVRDIENGIAIHIPSTKHKKDTSHIHIHSNEERFSDGCKLEYSCNDGYVLDGPDTLECDDKGRWSSAPPQCIRTSATSGSGFCRDPGVDPNGDRLPRTPPSRRGFQPGTQLEYSCDPTYDIRGQSTIICLISGEWSASRPRCRKKSASSSSSSGVRFCEDPGVDPNGIRLPRTPPNRRGFPPGTQLEYSCYRNYDLSGKSNLFCLSSGIWSASRPVCRKKTGFIKEVFCVHLGSVTNGHGHVLLPMDTRISESTEEYPVGTRIQYSCDSGYALEGQPTLTCEEDGLWSGEKPSCEKEDVQDMYCSDLGPLSNGHGHVFLPTDPGFTKPSANKYPEGTRLQYSCESGYILEGQPDLICEQDGFWSADKPTCERDTETYCKSPGEIENGDVEKQIPPVNKRREPRDIHSHNHHESEEQNPPEPRVQTQREREQPNPIVPRTFGAHGHIGSEEQYPVETLLQYSCKDGYRLEGPATLTCEDSGKWSAALPKCKRNDIPDLYCNDLGPLVNGHGHVFLPTDPGFTKPSANKYPVGTRNQYSCESGYVLEGQPELICEDDGFWSDEKPTCQTDTILYCPPQGEIANGNALHIPSTKHKKELTSHTHVGAEERYSDGCKLQYSCDDGYKLVGAGTLTCDAMGKWSSAPPKCVRNDIPDLYCNDLGPLVNGHGHVFLPTDPGFTKPVANKYPVGTRNQYSCESGYVLEGQPELVCEEDGFWSDEKPSCQTDSVLYCPPQGEIENGNALHIPSTKHKKELTSHTHVGAEERYSDGCKLQYSCDDGYRLVGTATLTCDAMGRWSSAPPKCIRNDLTDVYCSDLGPLVSGHGHVFLPTDPGFTKPSANKYPVGTRIQYSCEGGEELEGAPELVCEPDGFWSDDKPSCKTDFVDVAAVAPDTYCNDLGPLINGHGHVFLPTDPGFTKPSANKYPFGTRIQYSCESGYTLEGQPDLTCEQNGSWSDDKPSCDAGKNAIAA